MRFRNSTKREQLFFTLLLFSSYKTYIRIFHQVNHNILLQELTTMRVAMVAVLSTYELLENVLALLPARDIETVKLVSKTWYKLVKGSRRLRNAAVLRPVSYNSGVIGPAGDEIGRDVPTYAKGTMIYLHRSLQTSTRFPTAHLKLSSFDYYPALSTSFEAKRQHLIAKRQQHFVAKRQHFVTKPPCSAIHLHMEHKMGGNGKVYADCVVYVKGGITVGDLVDIINSMTAQECAIIGLPHGKIYGKSSLLFMGRLLEQRGVQ